MGQVPFFSIIVPVYNVSEYLRRCLDSILRQTFKDFECLLIDDGSTDDSHVICNEYAKRDGRFRFFQKENGGVSSARNLGLKHAKGAWICFIDSDDYVEAKYLSEFNRISNRGDLLCQGLIWRSFVGSKRKKTILENKFVERNDFVVTFTDLYQKKMYYYLMNKAFRHELIKSNKIHFDNNLRRRQDELFIDNYVSCISSINITSEAHYNYFFTPAEKSEYYSSVYKDLLFNLDSITYYCFYNLCQSKNDHLTLTRSLGSVIVNCIFSSFDKVPCFRQKKEILFLIKYIKPYKNSVSFAKSLKWRMLSSLLCSNYCITKLWLRSYIVTMRLKRKCQRYYHKVKF